MASTPLNALNAFLAVGRRRSFNAAAAELGISPSALSQSVRQLEARLGVTLLRRTTRSVALTDEGRRLFEASAPGIAQALEAMRTISAGAGEIAGRLRLSVPEIAAQHLFAPMLPAFLAQYPRIEVEVRVEDRLVDIVTEELDAGVRLSEAIQRDMVQVRLAGPFRYVVVGSPEYFERRGRPRKPGDLLAHECICYRSPTTGAPYHWELERGRRHWRVPVRGPLCTNDTALTVAMAEAGVGLAYCFEPRVREQLGRGTLELALEEFAPEVPGFFLYFPSRTQVSPPLRAFLEFARKRR